MVRLLVRSRGGSDLHWLVVRFRGERPAPTGGRSLSKDSALLLLLLLLGGGAGARLPRPRATSPPATPHWAWRDWSTWCLHAGTWARPR